MVEGLESNEQDKSLEDLKKELSAATLEQAYAFEKTVSEVIQTDSANNSEIFARLMYFAVKDCGVSMQDIANKCHVDRSTVVRWVGGKNVPPGVMPKLVLQETAKLLREHLEKITGNLQ